MHSEVEDGAFSDVDDANDDLMDPENITDYTCDPESLQEGESPPRTGENTAKTRFLDILRSMATRNSEYDISTTLALYVPNSRLGRELVKLWKGLKGRKSCPKLTEDEFRTQAITVIRTFDAANLPDQ